ncbi:MAG TPA: hypothetical protein ENH10_06195, partial [Bacteroidetes bacterium]|nr:hypothetical protein [Bacteroidota bacterium]HEX04735.1 hypothetical protein [Bacteroidota bacterium]
MKRTAFTVLIALVFTMSGFAADLVPLQPGVPAQPLQVVVKAETPHGLTIDITASGIMVENMSADATGHALLSWPNAGVEGRIGEAQIPVRRMLVAIPYGATVIPSISSQSWSTHDLATLSGSPTLMPVQPPAEKVEGLVVPFTKNADYYQTNSYSDLPTVEVEDYIVVRGQQMALVTVRPVNYNPAAGLIRIADQLEVEFEFDGGDDALTAAKVARYHDARTMNLLQESTINDIGREIDTLPASLGYYVIMP